jgi:hypothetical protein
MIANTKMSDLINENEGLSFNVDLLLKMAWPKLVNNHGCILLYDQLQYSHVTQEDFEDETGYEAFVNHVHLKGNEFGIELTAAEFIHVAIKIAETWKRKLALDFPDSRFMVIVGFYAEENEVILRFHKVRDNQAPWISINGIEKYVEPIMVL